MTRYIITGTLITSFLYIILLYNNIVKRKNAVGNAFGSIDAMLKKRYDLIPNLVEVVKQYMLHEATVFKDITSLRAGLSINLSQEKQLELHKNISSKLNEIMVTAENYPDLKASRNFLNLQAAWNETEEQISASRRFYNAAVTDYNNAIQTFPSNIIASVFGFGSRKVFEIGDVERNNINSKEIFSNNANHR